MKTGEARFGNLKEYFEEDKELIEEFPILKY